MQSYDFAYLNKKYKCILQVGGSDQWGNITEGMELCSRMNNAEGFALTSPLITKSDGEKMGKSLNGAISLNPDNTTSFEYFQYFRNVADSDAIKMLKIYTELSIEKINELSLLKGKDLNEVKKILAFEVLKLRENESIATKVLTESENIFTQNDIPEMEGLILKGKVGDTLLKVMLEGGVIKSMKEGKTLISAGAVKLNNNPMQDIAFVFKVETHLKISIGKKKYYKIIIS